MKKVLFIITILLCVSVQAKPPTKSKFYDFSEQVIDGALKRPTATFMTARERARFDRLLRLKKSFLPRLFQTSKHKVFK